MAFDQSLINDVLHHADIVDIISRYIDVIQKGREYVALCPFHDDRNPSMQISKTKQIFKCFVCGSGGNAIKFVEMYEHLNFFDAMRKVAQLSGYSDPRLEIKSNVKAKDPQIVNLENCINDLNVYYQYALNTSEGQEPLKYLNQRGIDDHIRKKFQIGYAFKDGVSTCKYLQSKGHSLRSIELIGIASVNKDVYSDLNQGRIIFSICDSNGQVVGFSSRRYLENDDSPKYINSPETPLFHKSDILYNFHNAKNEAKKFNYVYVVEGFMDAIALERIGISSVCALMGTAFTNQHLSLLRSLGVEIRFCLDGDEAGQMGHMRVINMLKNSDINCRFVKKDTNLGKDSDEILAKHGQEKLKQYLNNLLTISDFIFDYYENTSSLKSTKDRQNLIKYFLPLLLNCRSELEFDDYIDKLAKVSRYSADSIRNLVNKAKLDKEDDPNKIISNFHPEKKYLNRFRLAEKEILYYMLKDEKAIQFYENNIETFYDDIYRRIADYILDFYHQNKNINVSLLTSSIEAKESSNSDEIIKEILDISFESNHPDNVDKNYYESVFETIQKEKNKLYKKMTLEKMLENKSSQDKARILADWNKKMVKTKT